MRHSVRLLACGALVGGASLAMALPGGIALAKAPKPVTGTCTGLSGNATTQTLSGCTDPADTAGGGTSTTTSESVSGTTVTGTDSVTWNSSKTSLESFKGKLESGKKDKCTAPAGDSNVYEVKEKGKVTGGTATDLINGKTKGTVCVYSTASGGLVVQNFPGSSTSF
jgi:hypothetical protein